VAGERRPRHLRRHHCPDQRGDTGEHGRQRAQQPAGSTPRIATATRPTPADSPCGRWPAQWR
jgi:hypothetical protein